MMSRYYFELRDRSLCINDMGGEEFPGLPDAQAHAQRVADELARTADPDRIAEQRLLICDERHHVLAEIPLKPG